MRQEEALTLIHQAIEALEKSTDHQPTIHAVHAWLIEHHQVDLPIEQISGNMWIVYDLRQEEKEG